MSYTRHLLVVYIMLSISTLYGQEGENTTVLYQMSTYGRFKEGVFEGDLSVQQAKKHGDMGLGTFTGADGEMVALDGMFYYINVDGVATPAADTARLPFAQVTFFRNSQTARVEPFADYGQLKIEIDRALLSKKVLYAIQVSGTFSSLKTRSLPKQKRPYPPLDTAVAHQKIEELRDVEGTILGYWSPNSVGELSSLGYHLHFISQDRRRGGHVLDVSAKAPVTAKIQSIQKYEVLFPQSE